MHQARLETWAWEEAGTEAGEAGLTALPGPMAVGAGGPGQVPPSTQSTGPDRETVSPSAREPGSRHLPECSSLLMNAGITHGHTGDPEARAPRPGSSQARLTPTHWDPRQEGRGSSGQTLSTHVQDGKTGGGCGFQGRPLGSFAGGGGSEGGRPRGQGQQDAEGASVVTAAARTVLGRKAWQRRGRLWSRQGRR